MVIPMVPSTLLFFLLNKAMWESPSKRISSMLIISSNAIYSRVLPEFVAFGNFERSDLDQAPCRLLLVLTSAVGTSFVSIFSLLVHGWRSYRLSSLHIHLLCGYLSRYSFGVPVGWCKNLFCGHCSRFVELFLRCVTKHFRRVFGISGNCP